MPPQSDFSSLFSAYQSAIEAQGAKHRELLAAAAARLDTASLQILKHDLDALNERVNVALAELVKASRR